MSAVCHVERSRDISKYFRNSQRFLRFGRNDTESAVIDCRYSSIRGNNGTGFPS